MRKIKEKLQTRNKELLTSHWGDSFKTNTNKINKQKLFPPTNHQILFQ